MGLLWLAVFLMASPVWSAPLTDFLVSVGKSGAKVTVDRVVEEGKLVVSVQDAKDQPVLGLARTDFALAQLGKQANVTSVMPFDEKFDVPLNFVLIFDNSDSMRKRNAVEPLKEAAEELLRIIRPIDKVSLIVFDKNNTIPVGGRAFHLKVLKSSDAAEMRSFLDTAYSSKQVTYETWLFEAMLAGYDLLKKIPAEEQKFMIVFSDGEDFGSSVKFEAVEQAAQGLPEFGAYAIDFMPGEEQLPTLQRFASASKGTIWKAKDSSNLLPIFKEVAISFQKFYLLNYLFPPKGSLSVEPASLTIEEVKTIDASPMLGHIYFAEGSSEIPAHYLTPGSGQADFNEQNLKDTLDKYYQVLSVLGKRLAANPAATITLVGCNANRGVEKGNKELSLARARAVQEHLQAHWGIAADRMTLEARNLPAMPSTSRLDEGRADNRRVEIHSDAPEVLDLVRSTYIAFKADTTMLTVKPVAASDYGFTRWQMTVANNAGSIIERTGNGAPPPVIVSPIGTRGFDSLAQGGNLQVTLTAQDAKDQSLELAATPVQVNFIQTSKQMSQQQDLLVQEKYALILFDFDSDKIGASNQTIVAEIVGRIRELPQASVSIVGHSDNIGKPEYNLKLSERRAKAVYDQIIELYGGDDASRITYKGVGADEPLYENVSPETRAFNRTVTIILEYKTDA